MISDNIYTRIAQAFTDVQFGTISLIVQDGKVIQLEKHEKIRLTPEPACTRHSVNNSKAGELPALRRVITEAVNGLKYGQVVFVIKTGKVVQVERTDKSRVMSLEGAFGDGI